MICKTCFHTKKKKRKERIGKYLIFITSEWWHINLLVIYSKTEADEQVHNVFVVCLLKGVFCCCCCWLRGTQDQS